jgi:hypothetical protein
MHSSISLHNLIVNFSFNIFRFDFQQNRRTFVLHCNKSALERINWFFFKFGTALFNTKKKYNNSSSQFPVV